LSVHSQPSRVTSLAAGIAAHLAMPGSQPPRSNTGGGGFASRILGGWGGGDEGKNKYGDSYGDEESEGLLGKASKQLVNVAERTGVGVGLTKSMGAAAEAAAITRSQWLGFFAFFALERF